jgi:glycosyltransferase involved in cell wall biosynthesis
MKSAKHSQIMKVGYDAHAFVMEDGGTGKGIQLQNLLGQNLHTFIGFAPPGKKPSGLPLVRQGSPRYTVWQQLSLPSLLRSNKIDIFLAPYNTAPLFAPRSTKVVLVLHDLILMAKFKDTSLRGKINNAYRRWLIPQSVKRSQVVLTVSEYSRQRILERYPSARVEVIPCTIPEAWFVRKNVIPLDERGDYLFMVSASPPHKNLDRALQAFAAYVSSQGKSAVRMRVAGVSRSADALKSRAIELGIGDRVEFLPFITEQELQHAYRNAKAVLLPSLMEGFGIPVLEAMASGTPVISSNATSLPEVGGDAPKYFDPVNVSEMAQSIGAVLGDAALRSSMVKRGLVQAEIFHPSIISQQVATFWSELQNSAEDH